MSAKQNLQKRVAKAREAAFCHGLRRKVRRLWETRQESAQAKAALRQLAEKIGRCEQRRDPEESGTECYNTNLPEEQWCDVCKQKLPVWKHWHHKINAAAGALRSVLLVAQSLPPSAPDSNNQTHTETH